MPVVGEPGDQQGVFEPIATADSQWSVVAERSDPRCPPVHLLQKGHSDGPEDGLLAQGESDRGGKKGVAVGEVCGPIEGVNTPPQAVLLTGCPAFLSQHSNLRGLLRQQLQDDAFGSKVGIGDQVADAAFAFDGRQAPVVAHQFLATGIGR